MSLTYDNAAKANIQTQHFNFQMNPGNNIGTLLSNYKQVRNGWLLLLHLKVILARVQKIVNICDRAKSTQLLIRIGPQYSAESSVFNPDGRASYLIAIDATRIHDF